MAAGQQLLEAEFDALMARAGVVVPLARRAGYLVAYADMREQLALLHGVRSAAAEPANVYRVAAGEAGR